ncbi:hypothetical protein GCM10009688_10690 [Arthrobacter gandavensis]|uniref:Uncharacterized protein n=1 Tax=Arthrobacter gandavensis TaxID=169960 RepID=A0ABP5AB63_9MICC
MLAGIVGQVKRPAKGIKNRRRGVEFPPLFEPGIVIHAHSGQNGNLFAPEAWYPANSAPANVRSLRREGSPAGRQKWPKACGSHAHILPDTPPARQDVTHPG